jgi:hypothetical protein
LLRGVPGRCNGTSFPPDFPSAKTAAGLLPDLLTHPGFHSVAAEQHGRIVGTNFLDVGSTIAGVGPITIDAQAQDSGVGTLLMLDVIERARAKEFIGTRLLQAAYHNRACGLYAKLGFDLQEAIVTLQGPPVDKQGSRLQRPRGTRGRLGGDEPRCRRRDCRVHRHVAARGPANVARIRRHDNGLARRCLTKLRIRPGSPAAVRPGLARPCNSTVPQADPLTTARWRGLTVAASRVTARE